MKKISLFFAFLIVLLTCAVPLRASAAFDVSLVGPTNSNILYLVNLDDGTVVFDKNSNLRSAMASLTKIMTAIVALDRCPDLNTVVTAKQSAIDPLVGTDSSLAEVTAGMQLTMQQLLECMLIHSGNDAANVIAEHVGGSLSAFVEMMNAKAAELGCNDTHFTNTHGLDEPDHYTTAHDVAIMTKYALDQYPVFAKIVDTAIYRLPTTNVDISNTNLLLLPIKKSYYNPVAHGVKTGTTDQAGRCLVAYAYQNGYRYLSVVMQGTIVDSDGDATEEQSNFMDTNRMINWALDNLKTKEIATPNMIVSKEIPVSLSSQTDFVQLVPEKSVQALVPSNVDINSVNIEPVAGTLPETLKAPVKKGTVLGQANVTYGGAQLATINLVAASDIQRSLPLYLGHLAGKVLSSWIFRIILILAILFLIFYVAVNIIYNRQRKKRRLRLVKGNQVNVPNPPYTKKYKKK